MLEWADRRRAEAAAARCLAQFVSDEQPIGVLPPKPNTRRVAQRTAAGASHFRDHASGQRPSSPARSAATSSAKRAPTR